MKGTVFALETGRLSLGLNDREKNKYYPQLAYIGKGRLMLIPLGAKRI